MAHAQQAPWYRHRWPWLLMLGPLAAVLGGIATVYFAVTTNDGLVVDDYYKQGLAINKTLERGWRAGDLGLVAHVRVARETVTIQLDAKDPATLPEAIKLKLIHQGRAGMDRRLDAVLANGAYEVSILGLPPGHWQFDIEDAAGSWRLAATMALPEQTEATITAPQRP